RDEKATTVPEPSIAGAMLASIQGVRPVLTRQIAPDSRSAANTSATRLMSRPPAGHCDPHIRSEASDWKRMTPPSAEIAGWLLAPLAGRPLLLRLTSAIDPWRRASTNTSLARLPSPFTRSLASETRATKRPSSLIAAPELDPFVMPPSARVLIRFVV